MTPPDTIIYEKLGTVARLTLNRPERANALHADMLAGIPDAMLGETIHAIVVPRAGVVVDAQALRAWLTARIERYKVPDTIHFHHTLPCGPTGKADRRAAAAIMMAALATGRDST